MLEGEDLLCMVEVAPFSASLSGRNYNLPLFPTSEDQDEPHYQDTDLDVPEQRDGRCKVKWTPEEVSESLTLPREVLWSGASDMAPSAWVTPPQRSPPPVLLLERTLCLLY